MSFVTKYVNIHSNLKLICLFNYHFIYISLLFLLGFIYLLLCRHTYARQTVVLPQGKVSSFILVEKILKILVHSYDEIKNLRQLSLSQAESKLSQHSFRLRL